MINFDELPTTAGGNNDYIPIPDVYLAVIEAAEMRQPKDAGKKPYLNLQYRISKHDGSKAGVMFDAQYDSDKQAVKYKLARFLQACNIPLKGQMELKDLANLVVGKTIVVDTKMDETATKPKLQVDLFGREAYYPKEQFDEIWKLAHPDDDGFAELPDDAEVPSFMNVPEDAAEETEY